MVVTRSVYVSLAMYVLRSYSLFSQGHVSSSVQFSLANIGSEVCTVELLSKWSSTVVRKQTSGSLKDLDSTGDVLLNNHFLTISG